MHTVKPEGRLARRHFLEVHFTTTAGASTPCKWRVVVDHTRSGQGPMKIPGKTREARAIFKHNILWKCVQVATKDKSVPGFAVGDFNLELGEVKDLLLAKYCESMVVGGEGHGVCHACESMCSNCTALRPVVSAHLSVRRAQHHVIRGDT